MADFNVNLAAPSASGTQVISPVRDNRTDFPNPWIGVAASLAGTFLKNQEENKKKEKEDQQNAIVAEFTRSQTALNDSIAQGAPLSAAGTKARANFSKYAASYPHLADEFAKVNKTLFEYTELGEAKDERQMFKDARKEAIGSAVKAGYPIDMTTPDNVVDAQLKAFQVSRRAEDEFSKITKRNAEMRSASAEERQAFDFESKQQSVKLLSTIADSHLDAAFLNAQAIAAETAQSGDINAGKFKLTQSFSNIERAIAAASALHPELGKTYKALFDEVKQIGMDQIEGKTVGAAAENQLKALKTKIMLTTLASPENKAFYGMSQVFNGNIPSTFLQANTAARDTITQLTLQFGGVSATPAPQVVGQKGIETPAYDLFKSQVSAIEAGKAPNSEATKVALGNAVNNVLTQVSRAASTDIKPDQLATTFNFIASPEYAKMISYGKINPEAAQGAQKVFSLMYENEVAKSLEKRLEEPFRAPGKLTNGIAYADLVNFTWNGTRVTAEQATNVPRLDMMETGDRDRFVQQMETNTKVINQLIKAGAHMEGHTNYDKYWEANKHNILPSIFPDPARLKVGQVVDGYKYIGGNYKSKGNWIKEPESK